MTTTTINPMNEICRTFKIQFHDLMLNEWLDLFEIEQSTIPGAGYGVFAKRPYSEGDVLGVFYGTVQELKQVVTPSSYAMKVEWPPTMDEKNPPRKIKNYIVDPLRGPSSAISLATPAWFGLHMANDFNWGKKLVSVET